MSLLLLSLLACGSPQSDDAPGPGADGTTSPDGGQDPGTDPGQDDDPDDGSTDDEPSDYVYEEDPEQPLWTLTQVEDAMTSAVFELSGFDVVHYLSAYDQAFSEEDDDCPSYLDNYLEDYGYWYWYDSCTAGTGASYSGYAYGNYSDPYWSGDYYYSDYGWMYGDFSTTLTDGQSLDFSGYIYNYRYEYAYDSRQYWYTSFTGDAVWGGDDYVDTWLSETWSVSLVRSAYQYDQGYSSLSLSGGVSNMDGATNAIHFEDFWYATELGGSSCPEEPSGVVRVRDEEGDWYEVMFHGPPESGGSSFPEDCDGCGEVWYRGTELGLACPDFTPLHDWAVGGSR